METSYVLGPLYLMVKNHDESNLGNTVSDADEVEFSGEENRERKLLAKQLHRHSAVNGQDLPGDILCFRTRNKRDCGRDVCAFSEPR
jgi:hypothetical protein